MPSQSCRNLASSSAVRRSVIRGEAFPRCRETASTEAENSCWMGYGEGAAFLMVLAPVDRSERPSAGRSSPQESRTESSNFLLLGAPIF